VSRQKAAKLRRRRRRRRRRKRRKKFHGILNFLTVFKEPASLNSF